MKLRHGLLGLALLTLTGAAAADLPPPDGTKFVSFEFRVENLTAFTEHVLLAYPCSSSSGMPVAAHVRLEEGKVVRVGRRGGDCKLYSMKKSAYEQWAKSYTASGQSQDPALEALFKSAQVVECAGSPTLTSSLPSTDPRDVVSESLRAERIDDRVCRVTTVPAKDGPPLAPPPTTATAAATAAATATPAPAEPPRAPSDAPAQPEAKSGGCAGCSLPARAPAPSGWLAALVLAIGLRRIRVRRLE